MKLPASLIFGLLVFSLPYPSLNLLPESISQDVQPVFSGFFALLSLAFYFKKSNLRSTISFKVIFPAAYLACITLLYAVASLFVGNHVSLNLVVERGIVLFVAAIFYMSGVGIAYVCSQQTKKIFKYFNLMLGVVFAYGSVQLLGIALKSLLGFSLFFDLERLFREVVLTRAQAIPRLVFFITEPSFLPSFLMFIFITASLLTYFRFKHINPTLSTTTLNNYVIKKNRLLSLLLICAVVFSFSISVYIVALAYTALIFLLTLIQGLSVKNKEKKLKNLLLVVSLSVLVFLSVILVVFTDYISLLFVSSPIFASNPVLQRVINFQGDPSSVIRVVKLNALTSCSVEHFPFGAGLGGYYDESVQLINQAISSVTTSINPLEVRQLKIESEQSSSHLYSVIFGTTCEMGFFGFLFILFMFLPSILFFITTFTSSSRAQLPFILPLASVSGITILLVFVSGIPFALPYPWIVIGMCNYLLLDNRLKPHSTPHTKMLSHNTNFLSYEERSSFPNNLF